MQIAASLAAHLSADGVAVGFAATALIVMAAIGARRIDPGATKSV